MNNSITHDEMKRALQERDDLQQQCVDLQAALLEAPNAQMVALLAAVGSWLDEKIADREDGNDRHHRDFNWKDADETSVFNRVQDKLTELKAQHLGEPEVE